MSVYFRLILVLAVFILREARADSSETASAKVRDDGDNSTATGAQSEREMRSNTTNAQTLHSRNTQLLGEEELKRQIKEEERAERTKVSMIWLHLYS